MPLTPALVEYLVAVTAQARAAGHGGKEAVYAAACSHLNISRATLMRRLKEVAVKPERKQRSDAGAVTLPLAEAKIIAAYVMEHFRQNDKRGIALVTALKDLRANGLVRAERLDAVTGEVALLSPAAVVRALRHYGLHWEQLRRQSAAVPQSSPHPNHTWQMDFSVCTLFYIDDDGTEGMPKNVFYKNKPENFERVAKKRVLRGAITDHTSGAVKVRYFLGGESVANVSEFFLWAIQKSADPRDPFHGVPLQLMVDPGSGVEGAFKNLVRRLQIRLIVNAPGNPRAKGQVENAHNLIEMGFEHQFRVHRPKSLAELNERAEQWQRWFNATQIHGRHGMTRYAKWMEIKEVRTAPPIERCRELLTHAPVKVKVDQFQQVRFGGQGRRWNVAQVPNVMVGEWLHVTWNNYNDREIFVVDTGADGNEALHACPLVEMDANGFQVGAREVGSGYQALPDTVADAARKELDQIATGAASIKQAAKARRGKQFEAFSGKVRFDHLDREAESIFLPKKSVALDATATVGASDRTLTLFEAAGELVRRGLEMNAERHAQVRAWYPDGVPESELDQLQQRLTVRATLRVVGGDQ